MPTLPRALNDFFKALFNPSIPALQFAVKNMLGGGLALYLAFILQMQQPQWALITVFIVNQPLSGMVLSKGAYRLLGTLVGAVVSLGMIALLGQSPWLFLPCMALWLGFCTAGASLYRNNASYGFVLAGYTTAIVALPSTAAPLNIFDQAQARFFEITLGIVCASLVSTLLWPRRLERQLALQARGAWQSGMAAAASELLGVDQRQGLLDALGRIVSVDSQRDHAAFEGSSGRLRAQALQVMSRDLLSLLRVTRGVARLRLTLDQASGDYVDPLIKGVARALADGAKAALDQQAIVLDESLLVEGLDPQVRACLMRMTVVLRLANVAVQSLKAVEQREPVSNVPGPLAWHRDIEQGVMSGLRSALAFLAVAGFWVFTAWPAGLGAVSSCGVVLSLFAGREAPADAALSFLKGIALSVPIAALVAYGLLPAWEGFPMLCLGLGIPLFIASLCLSQPSIAPIASAFCIFFVTNVAPRNVMNYDLERYLNGALATLFGVGIAVVVFRLVTLGPGLRHHRRLVEASLADLSQLTQRPLEQAEGWFGGRMADRLMRLGRYRTQYPDEPNLHWYNGLHSLDLGGELLHLRGCLTEATGPTARERDRYMHDVARLLKQGPPALEQITRLDEPSVQLLKVLEADTQLTVRRQELAQAAVLQLQFVWRRWSANSLMNISAYT
ncbi:FUSC family protein [Pseudomonas akapageensis]|uniref:FUSC family protein n=1 Tax=Pseudomonas akapageensis TaxID=2609961 RepID=UPI00140878FE|nr:FUSC family protein [Pseudomonas akapageensis]